MPVLEALTDTRITVERVLVARNARGESVTEILAAAGRQGLAVQRVAPEKVTRVSGNARHDQGVVADIEAPGIAELDEWLSSCSAEASQLLVLDGVTNPANVGMIVRTAAGAGLAGVVLPRSGSPDVGPLVIKASAGVALRAVILRVATAADAVDQLSAAGFDIYGMRTDKASPLWHITLGSRAAWVLGNETDGVSASVAKRVTQWVSLPLANDVESLNVASVAAVVSYEVARRTVEASQRPK
jgi:23S rRNA (guanosine2251-2'-O)-methyltransferase